MRFPFLAIRFRPLLWGPCSKWHWQIGRLWHVCSWRTSQTLVISPRGEWSYESYPLHTGLLFFTVSNLKLAVLLGSTLKTSPQVAGKVMVLPRSSSHLKKYMERLTLMFLRATDGMGSYQVALKTILSCGQKKWKPVLWWSSLWLWSSSPNFYQSRTQLNDSCTSFPGTKLRRSICLIWCLDMSDIWDDTNYCWHMSFEHANGYIMRFGG